MGQRKDQLFKKNRLTPDEEDRMDLLANHMIDLILDQIERNKRKGETANDCLKRLNKELEKKQSKT